MATFKFELLERKLVQDFPIKNTEEFKIEATIKHPTKGVIFNDKLKVRHNITGIHIPKDTLEYLKSEISDSELRGIFMMELRKYAENFNERRRLSRVNMQ